MISLNFEADSHSRVIKTRKGQPQVRKEYAAGFRGYGYKNNSGIPQQSEDSIHQFLQEIGVINLPELYDSLQPPAINNSLASTQQQSVNRLYLNQYPKHKNRSQQQEEEVIEEQKKSNRTKWQIDKKYENQPEVYAVRKQVQKTRAKIAAELRSYCKRNKIEPALSTNLVFSGFIIEMQDQLTIPSIITEEELLILWKNFINQGYPDRLAQRLKGKTITTEAIHRIEAKNKYLYCLLQPTSTAKNPMNYLQLDKAIGSQLIIPAQQLISAFKFNLHYTRPFNISTEVQNKGSNHSKSEEDEVNLWKFKANPVPKSTYKVSMEKRHENENAEKKKGVSPQPFHLSENKTHIPSYEQYYHWDRQFKAKPVPETNYKPQRPHLLSEAEKKARAVLQLEQASYPKTMEYLNDYKNKLQMNKQEAEKLYSKKNDRPVLANEIPNFEYLHAKQVVQFEAIKEKNRNKLEIKPFKLSQNRPKTAKQAPALNIPSSLASKPKTQQLQNIPECKSTLKFEAYVKYRNEQKEKAEAREAQKRKMGEEIQKKNEGLRDILKARMSEELLLNPRQNLNPDPIKDTKINVDYERIYWERPLLMGERSNKSVGSPTWKSIFMD